VIPSSTLSYGFLIAGVLGVILGVIIFAIIDRRMAARERAKALLDERQPLPPEPNQMGTFTNLRVPVNLVVERCDAVRAAAILREHSSSPKSLPQAAE
jgi:hypothetical protein